MGNCLKSNTVVPHVVKDKADEMLARGTPRQGGKKVEQEDMAKSLKEEDKDAKVAGGGVSFIVDFTSKKKKVKKPPKVGKKDTDAATEKNKVDLPIYSVEEKALMAEILRADQLRERREKARSVDIKSFDAKRRRMFRIAEAEALREQKELSEALAGAEKTKPDGSDVDLEEYHNKP